ncbi:MAG: translocated intimin receptor Tir [Acidobacteria bacterium]|nr:translocated intimin receptor Tir [Acidobacteriota bacterium]
MNDTNLKKPPESLFRIILRDIHFWIPLLVLIAGILFLRELH